MNTPEPITIDEFEELIWLAAESKGAARNQILEKITDYMYGWLEGNETRTSIRRFLIPYCNNDAVTSRMRIDVPEDMHQMFMRLAIPLIHTFNLNAGSDEHEKQIHGGDEGSRCQTLAEWMRDLFVQRDVAKVEALMHFVKVMPNHIELPHNVTYEEFTDQIKHRHTKEYLKNSVNAAVNDLIFENKRFPTKAELRREVERRRGEHTAEIDSANWRKILKALGLSGLPAAKGGKRRS